ncbi:MAG: anti-sigma factor [Caldilineaceae bacterium]
MANNRHFTINSDNLDELLTGYVLSALEPDEMLAVEAHLQAHPELRSRVRRLEETTALLAYAAPQVAPPASAKERLLARAQEATQMPQFTPIPVANDEATKYYLQQPLLPRAYTPLNRSEAAPIRIERRSTWFDLSFGWKAVTVGAAVALLFFVVLATQLQNRLNQVVSQLNVVQQQMAALQENNSQLQQTNLTQQRALADLVNTTQVIQLTGSNGAAVFMVDAQHGTLIIHGLAPLPPDQIYELWLIPANADPVAAGRIQIENQNTPTLISDVPLTLSNFAAVGVSIEPFRGDQPPTSPTGPIVLLGQRT